MIDIVRRALLGDRQAQEECTRQGIVLPCPMCGEKQEIDFRINKVHHKRGKCLFSNKYIELDDWNTRLAPPIGRCKDCANKEKATVNDKGFLVCPASGMEITDDDFCSYFEPKGENENEV